MRDQDKVTLIRDHQTVIELCLSHIEDELTNGPTVSVAWIDKNFAEIQRRAEHIGSITRTPAT